MVLDAGQTEVKSSKSDAQATVVKPQAMQDRGLDIVNVHRVLNDVEPKFIGAAERHPGPDSTAGQPHGERLGMVIPA